MKSRQGLFLAAAPATAQACSRLSKERRYLVIERGPQFGLWEGRQILVEKASHVPFDFVVQLTLYQTEKMRRRYDNDPIEFMIGHAATKPLGERARELLRFNFLWLGMGRCADAAERIVWNMAAVIAAQRVTDRFAAVGVGHQIARALAAFAVLEALVKL